MAHHRKFNASPALSDPEEVFEPLKGLEDPRAKLRPSFGQARPCSVVCFGLVMALTGAILGMYFKADIMTALGSTAGHWEWIATTANPVEAVRSLYRPGEVRQSQQWTTKPSYIDEGDHAKVEAEGKALRAEWDSPWLDVTVCDDSCPTSKDGKCDDGRSGSGQVLCDLGTDCTDCGYWSIQMPAHHHPVSKPIKLLREHDIVINVAKTSTVPSFLMPYTDPEQDIDVSSQMDATQAVELGLTQAWFKSLDGKCKGKNGHRALVLDIGANFGYYSLYAAAHGCRVVAWEPVPKFRAFLEYALQVNNMTKSIRIRERVVSDKSGQEYSLTVPFKGIWGTASIDSINIDEALVGDHREEIKAFSERADALISEDILVTKVDVEGFEPLALRSLRRIFDNYRIETVFMEYSPGVYEHGKKWDQLQDVPLMLSFLLQRNYTILHVNDSMARGVSLLEGDWKAPLPALEEVLAANVQHDLDDVEALQNGVLGCYAPNELTELNQAWEHCNALPEDLHPKGFRGTFGHNTNIWATLDRGMMKIGAPVGVQSPDQPDVDWYGKSPEFGMGGRLCSTIEPKEVVLRHRCPCEDDDCRKEAALVESLAKKKKMRLLSNHHSKRLSAD